jgi:hypothetical protein
MTFSWENWGHICTNLAALLKITIVIVPFIFHSIVLFSAQSIVVAVGYLFSQVRNSTFSPNVLHILDKLLEWALII